MRESARTLQRIYAACVQKNEVSAVALLKLFEHFVKRHGASINVVPVAQLEVDREKEIVPVHL